jgi:hypothetical protein
LGCLLVAGDRTGEREILAGDICERLCENAPASEGGRYHIGVELRVLRDSYIEDAALKGRRYKGETRTDDQAPMEERRALAMEWEKR